MSYEGLDHELRSTRIECDPEPLKITSSDLQFEASLAPSKSAAFHFSVECDPSSQRRSVGDTRAMSGADTELHAVSSKLCEISSSNDRMSRWIRRSLADVEMMTMGNPEANYPYAGVPWFSGEAEKRARSGRSKSFSGTYGCFSASLVQRGS